MAATPATISGNGGVGSLRVTDNGDNTTTLNVSVTAGPSGGQAVTIADGADVTEGAKADAAWSGTGSGSLIAIDKAIYGALVAALPAGANIIGKVGIDQTTPGTTNGVQVNAALPAGSNIIGSNLSRAAAVSVTPTVTASSAYTANNEVGGLMTFASMFGTANSGIIQDIKIKSKSIQTAQFNLYVFKTNPTNSTWTDKSAPAINAADIPFLEVAIPFTSPYSGLGTHTLYSADALGTEIVASSTSLYAILTTSGTPTFTSTSDITVEIIVLQD